MIWCFVIVNHSHLQLSSQLSPVSLGRPSGPLSIYPTHLQFPSVSSASESAHPHAGRKKERKYESGGDRKRGGEKYYRYEIIRYNTSSHIPSCPHHFCLKLAQSNTFQCISAHLLEVMSSDMQLTKAITCLNVNRNTLTGIPKLSHILSPIRNSFLHLLLRLCLSTLHSFSGRSQPCNCYLSVSKASHITPWWWALVFQEGSLDSCQHWPDALYS